MIFSIVVVFLFAGLQSTQSTANNSLSNCNALAAKFNITCCEGAVLNITAHIGTNISCASGFTNETCPGMMYNSTCVFPHKLCITCSGSSNATIRIRVQSNGLPPFCPNVPVPIRERNIDFEVNFNPDVNVNAPVQTPTSLAALNGIVCNISSQTSVPAASNFTSYSNPSTLNTVVGVSVDGVTILNANSANNVDPFYPTGNFAVESVDACLGHPNPTDNGYHYHAASACALNGPIGSISSCASTPMCNASVANYTISMFSSYRNLTVVGIAKDGHIIYGPYDSAGVEVTSGFDICNGMFYDSMGNYAYFATRTYPYVVGCFGPGNYPTFVPNCTTNAPAAYNKSIYALNQTTIPNFSTNLQCRSPWILLILISIVLFAI